MKVSLVAPRDGLVAAVGSRLEAAGNDYSRSWVVFPERRPGYYLRRDLARRAGKAFIPPRIDSLDAFVDRVFEAGLGRKERLASDLDAVALLFEIHHHSSERLGGASFLALDQFFPLGMKLFSDLEELASAGVAKNALLEVDDWSGERVPARARESLQRLSFFYEEFYATLEARGMSTRASRLRAAAGGWRPELFPGVDRLIFAGFFALAGAEADLLRTVLAGPRAELLLLAGKGAESVLDILGVDDPGLRSRAVGAELEPPPPVEFIRSADTHGQIFALNATLASAREDGAPLDESRAVVLPASETLFPLYQQTLAALDPEGYNISLGYPLVRTPVYGFFLRLLELVRTADETGRVYMPDYLRFVLHPYAKNLYFPGPERRTDFTRILFHAVEEAAAERRTRSFRTLEDIETDEATLRAIQEMTRNLEGAPPPAAFAEHLAAVHRALIAPLFEIRDVGDFAAKLAGVLRHVYENSTARLHAFFHPYAAAFLRRFEALERSLLAPASFADRAGYLHLFRKVAAAGAVPFSGTPLRGLQVVGFWEARGLPFDDVSVLDVNEDVVPSFKRADSLLSPAARLKLGLPTYRDQERRMAYALDTLIRGAKRVRLFFVENNEKERSRFVQSLLWERQKRDAEPRAGKLVGTVRYDLALEMRDPAAVAKTPETAAFLRDFAYSATALDAYLRCPLKFYHRHVLNLREKEDPAEELEARDLGILVHKILQEHFQPFVGRPLLEPDLAPGPLEERVERAFVEAFGEEASGAAYLMKLQMKRHLAAFLEGHQAPLLRSLRERRMELRIVGLEKRLEVFLAVPASALGGGVGRTFRVKAFLDRVELRGPDLHLLDYKTSANPAYLDVKFRRLDLDDRESWSRAVGSLQLPLYHLVLARAEKLAPEKIRGRFLLLGKNRLDSGIEFSPFDEENEEERREEFRAIEELIGRLLLEISDPAVPFRPAAEPGACRICDFRPLCGRM